MKDLQNKLQISNEDMDKFIDSFFSLIDAHYGTALHHIGDGDGITDSDVGQIKNLYNKYSNEFWKLLKEQREIAEKGEVWVDAKKELPKKYGVYDVKTSLGTEDVLEYRIGFEGRNEWYDLTYKDSVVKPDYVLFWKPRRNN